MGRQGIRRLPGILVLLHKIFFSLASQTLVYLREKTWIQNAYPVRTGVVMEECLLVQIVQGVISKKVLKRLLLPTAGA